jgi:hypothetical protein
MVAKHDPYFIPSDNVAFFRLLFNYDTLGAASVFIATLLSLSGYIEAGLAALVITSAQQFTRSIYWASRLYTELESK